MLTDGSQLKKSNGQQINNPHSSQETDTASHENPGPHCKKEMSDPSPEKRLLIYACAIISVIGMLCLTFLVPAANGMITQVSNSTKADVKHSSDIEHLFQKVDHIELAINRLSRMEAALARIEGRLESWEPNK